MAGAEGEGQQDLGDNSWKFCEARGGGVGWAESVRAWIGQPSGVSVEINRQLCPQGTGLVYRPVLGPVSSYLSAGK